LAKAESEKRQAEKFTVVFAGNFQPCDSGFEFGLRLYFAHFVSYCGQPFPLSAFSLGGARLPASRFAVSFRSPVSGFRFSPLRLGCFVVQPVSAFPLSAFRFSLLRFRPL
jgi:hypothetical protein